jgi:hypothetical protein
MSAIIVPLLQAAADSGASAAATAGILGAIAVFYAALFAMGALAIVFYCAIILFWLVVVALWIWMLVDCLTRKDFDKEDDKLLWAIVILLGSWIGMLLYYFLVKRKKDALAKPAAGVPSGTGPEQPAEQKAPAEAKQQPSGPMAAPQPRASKKAPIIAVDVKK